MVIDYRYCPVDRSFHFRDELRTTDLGQGLESWPGFFQSIRPTQMGLSLNIGIVVMTLLPFLLCWSILYAFLMFGCPCILSPCLTNLEQLPLHFIVVLWL